MDLIDQESPAMLLDCYWLSVDVIVIGILLHRGKKVHHRIDLGSAEYVRLHPTTNFRKLPYQVRKKNAFESNLAVNCTME